MPLGVMLGVYVPSSGQRLKAACNDSEWMTAEFWCGEQRNLCYIVYCARTPYYVQETTSSLRFSARTVQLGY